MEQPGRWWSKEEERVRCNLCPRDCLLSEGQRGFCFVRQNIGGEIVLTTYGKSTGFCIDPIEKKPLNHFLPGTPVLSFGTAGCNLGCKFCQNWDISKAREIEVLSDYAAPEAIVQAAKSSGSRSIAFTYNDPVIWAEYAIDTAHEARQEGLKTVAVTAGYISKLARREFFEVFDAANVDLKAFTERFYHKLTFAHLEPVLETLRFLKQETPIWFEITNLMIPDENDSPDEIHRMCDWILENLGDSVPVHFTAFHPDFKMKEKIPTPLETLQRARNQARSLGIKYAYVGNCHDVEGQSTFCPNCKTVLIERDWYELGIYQLSGNRCLKCGEAISGVFEDHPGSWGRKRLPIPINSDTEDAAVVELRRDRAVQIRSDYLQAGQVRGAGATDFEGSRQNTQPTIEGIQSRGDDEMLPFAPRTEFTENEKKALLNFASVAVRAAVTQEELQASLPRELAEAPGFGVFTSLKRGQFLRGCRGQWGTATPTALKDLIMRSARDTAVDDGRFPSIHPAELPLLALELSVLCDPVVLPTTPAERLAAVKVGIHGLVLSHPQGRALLLPQVAEEQGWDAKTFLEQLAQKAALPQTAWQEGELLSFRAVHFNRPGAGRELDASEIPDRILAELLQVANLLTAGVQKELRLSPVCGETLQAEFGIRLQTVTGKESISFGRDVSLIELISRIVERFRNAGVREPIQSIMVYCMPIPLKVDEYPARLKLIGPGAIQARFKDKGLVVFPTDGSGQDLVLQALHGVGASEEDWRKGDAFLVSYRIRYGALPKEAFVQNPPAETKTGTETPKGDSAPAEEKSIEQQSAPSEPLRAPAVAGAFYPSDPKEMNRELTALLGKPGKKLKKVQAVMLPHAGWSFCGKIIAQTLKDIEIPKTVIILGPKHTASGSHWSVASHDRWTIPGAEVPIAKELVQELQQRCPRLEIESAAHQTEHGSEVLVPFLHYLNPEVQIVPIALGFSELADGDELVRALIGVLESRKQRPLLIISSDMNHFATEAENRKLDGLALKAFERRDGDELFEVCRDREISMCGVLPAAIVLKTLRQLSPNFKVTRTGYGTSADSTGDKARVVGYAGAQLT